MKQFFITFSCFLLPAFLFSQELFPNTEPASNMPKGVLAFRIAGEYYSEVGQPRIWTGYRFKYGFTARMEADLTIGLSNHHGDLLPPGFVSTDGNIGPHTHGGKKGIYYPYRFEGIDIYAKYRFLNIDGEHRHFRMAAYAEISTARVAHDETEPNLMMEDNAGAGGGIVATYLYHKLAVSTTLGGIFPVAFSGHQEMPNNERGPDITIHYGNAFNYCLSIGFLAYPYRYKSYKDVNINLYAEFYGKDYQAAKIYSDGQVIPVSGAPTLDGGNYVEARPAIQFIFKSNFRVDLCYGMKMIGRSYVNTYPLYMFNIQYYFFPKIKKYAYDQA